MIAKEAIEILKANYPDACFEQLRDAVDMAIKALEQPECEDAVPWEQLERYAEWFCALVSYPEFVREAKAFCESTIADMKGGNIEPSITPKQPGWIPCSERLPYDCQWYYATCKSLIDNRENWVIEGCYTPWERFNSTPMIRRGEAEVIAWMPKEFPEPYKEER